MSGKFALATTEVIDPSLETRVDHRKEERCGGQSGVRTRIKAKGVDRDEA